MSAAHSLTGNHTESPPPPPPPHGVYSMYPHCLRTCICIFGLNKMGSFQAWVLWWLTRKTSSILILRLLFTEIANNSGRSGIAVIAAKTGLRVSASDIILVTQCKYRKHIFSSGMVYQNVVYHHNLVALYMKYCNFHFSYHKFTSFCLIEAKSWSFDKSEDNNLIVIMKHELIEKVCYRIYPPTLKCR